jgi:hypothetical protein
MFISLFDIEKSYFFGISEIYSQRSVQLLWNDVTFSMGFVPDIKGHFL